MPKPFAALFLRLALGCLAAIGPFAASLAAEFKTIPKRGPAETDVVPEGFIELEEMIGLRDGEDFVTAEKRLNALRKAIEEERATWHDYFRLFTAFRTIDLRHIKFLESWREAMPWSAHAEAALGFRSLVQGSMFRGDDLPSRTPDNALTIARELFETALGHYEAALELDPGHYVAASGIVSLSRRGYVSEQLTLARRNVEAHAGPVSRMKSGVIYTLPQWGGSAFGAQRYCHEQAAQTDRFTVDECLAVGLTMGGPTGKALAEGAEVLMAADEDLYAREIVRALLFLRRHDELLGLLERTGHRLATHQLRDAPYTKLVYDQYLFWFRIDPGNPYVAQMTARVAIANLNFEDARQALDHAILVFPVDEEIHSDKLNLLMVTRDFAEVLPAMEAAAEGTDGNADSYLPVLIPVLDNLGRFRDGPDGEPHRDLQCRVSRLVETAERYCASIGSRPSYCYLTRDAEFNPYRELWTGAESALGPPC